MPPAAVVIHGLDDARAAVAAAAALGRRLRLVSAPGAAGYAGAAWFRHVVAKAAAERPEVEVEAVIDCADAAGDVLGVLRDGARLVRFTGPPAVADKLAMIAAAHGAQLVTDEGPALDLAGIDDREAACRTWLAMHDDA